MTEIISVIGAGQIGNGIAHVVALAGRNVRLLDVGQEQLDAALATIAHNMDRQMRRKAITTEEKEAALKRIETGTDLAMVAGCDLVIEAASEDEETKCGIFEAIGKHLPETAIIATNSSSLSVTRLGAVSGRPDRFIGMHFMNPVPMIDLVELIRGLATSEETFHTARALVETLGKTVAVAEDFPAYIVNRVLMPMINEAVYTLYEGVATVAAIDKAISLGANHRMGPLELADFMGLDTCLSIMQVLHDGLADSKYRPCPLLVKYVEAGWLGRKSGRGFYDYSSGEPVPTR